MADIVTRKDIIFEHFPWTLQHYEKVVLRLLRDDLLLEGSQKKSFPRYDREIVEKDKENIWNRVPEPCHPRVPTKRLKRKRWQLESVIRFAMSVMKKTKKCSTRKILDLCGGTGQIGLIMASLLPDCEVVICDFNKDSIDIAKKRIHESGMENVTARCCDVRDLKKSESFTLGIALHACGIASDFCMQLCCEANAAFVVCPCCVGKLAAGKSCTRSKLFRTRFDEESYEALVRAADWNAHRNDLMNSSSSNRGILCKIAKSFLEADRMEWVRESYNYDVHLTKMRPLESSPKNDILIGVPNNNINFSSSSLSCCWCRDDKAMMFPKYLNRLVHSLCSNKVSNSAIWDMAFVEYEDLNVNEIAEKLQVLSKQERNTRIVFPVGQGKRTRRMIHLLSDLIHLRHWSEGKNKSRHIIVEK